MWIRGGWDKGKKLKREKEMRVKGKRAKKYGRNLEKFIKRICVKLQKLGRFLIAVLVKVISLLFLLEFEVSDSVPSFLGCTLNSIFISYIRFRLIMCYLPFKFVNIFQFLQ
jgi:hypothetical protein